jgi:probable F420-dependent oxidoreductase
MVAVGAFLPNYGSSNTMSARNLLDVATLAERRGLHHLWVGDHFVWNTGMLAPLPTLAAVAAVTENIRLGTGVYLLNLRHPAIVAKDVATVDVLSGGRVTLGVGVGGDDPNEYAALGVDVARRGARLDEMIESLRSLLNRDGAAYGGSAVSLPAFTMEPPPVQSRVPIWLGGRAEAVIERAATVGDGWFPVWVSAKRIAHGLEVVGEKRGGLDGFAAALNVFVAIGETREKAGEQVAEHLWSAYRLPFEKFERYAAYGTADQIAEFLSAYVDIGVTDIALNLTGPDRTGQLTRLIDEVLPLIGWTPRVSGQTAR